MNNLIEKRFHQYSIKTIEDKENALKEILQEIALYGLSSSDFFGKAMFQGGTALRILYRLPRFSEDLDFLLKYPDRKFIWKPYLDSIKQALEFFSIDAEIIDREKADKNIQKLFLKDRSIGKLLSLHSDYFDNRKLVIKLEIDINPPAISGSEIKFLEFPMDYSVCAQDLPSNFAGKCHALLCRKFLKPRDWFDFAWYVSQNIPVNLNFLEAAINQSGFWQKQGIKVDKEWLSLQLAEKIATIDWERAKSEIERFLNKETKAVLDLWSKEFFMSKLEKLECCLV